MYTSITIILVIYIACLPITLKLFANKDKMEAIDPNEPNWLTFIKIWLITPAFIIKLFTSKN